MSSETTTAQPGLRSRKYADARRALFQAAMELFRERGFEETSVDLIVERAGFSRATFFNHFGSKPAVLRYYGEQLQERVREMLSTAAHELPPLDRLKAVLQAMAKDVQEHRDDVKLVFAYSIHDEAYLMESTPARESTLRMLTDIIADAQSAGQARGDLSAIEQARQIVGLYNNAVLMIVFGGRNAKAAINSMWNFAVGGICGGNTLAK